MRWLALASLVVLAAAPLAQAVPSSARSTAVEARVTPKLAEAFAAQGLTLGAPVFVRIFKQPGTLELFVRGDDGGYRLFKRYPICTFSGDLGPKLRTGDGQAPEGVYAVRAAQMNPASAFHLSFNLGYPNAFDRAHGRTGSALMVHGNCVSIGCYAMGDPAIEEIWTAMAAAMRAGQASVPVHAFPFALTPQALAARKDDRNAAFWADLAPIYAAFETSKRPPRVVVEGGRYRLR